MLCLYLCLCLSVPVSISLSLSVYICLWLSVCQYLSLSLSGLNFIVLVIWATYASRYKLHVLPSVQQYSHNCAARTFSYDITLHVTEFILHLWLLPPLNSIISLISFWLTNLMLSHSISSKQNMFWFIVLVNSQLTLHSLQSEDPAFSSYLWKKRQRISWDTAKTI